MNTPATHLNKSEIALALRVLRRGIEAQTGQNLEVAQECLLVDVCGALGLDNPTINYVMGLDDHSRYSPVLGSGKNQPVQNIFSLYGQSVRVNNGHQL